MKNSTTSKLSRQVWYLLGFILFVAVWEIISLSYSNDLVFPGIIATLKALIKMLISFDTYNVLFHTLFRLVFSTLISFAIALILAVLSYVEKRVKYALSFIITTLKTLPIASIIIIMLIFVGHERSPFYITIFVMLPILYEGILNALTSIDKDILDEVKQQSDFNMIVLKDIYIPLISKDIITALLQSVGLGLKVVVMAEFITQPEVSIGRSMLECKNNYDFDYLFAWTILLIFIVIFVDLILRKIKDRLN